MPKPSYAGVKSKGCKPSSCDCHPTQNNFECSNCSKLVNRWLSSYPKPFCPAVRKLLHNWLQLPTGTRLVARGDPSIIILVIIMCWSFWQAAQYNTEQDHVLIISKSSQPWSCTLAGSSLFFCVLDVVILGSVPPQKNTAHQIFSPHTPSAPKS